MKFFLPSLQDQNTIASEREKVGYFKIEFNLIARKKIRKIATCRFNLGRKNNTIEFKKKTRFLYVHFVVL